MSDLRGFWIRREVNVQVRCLQHIKSDDSPDKVFICFKNGHTKTMTVHDFKDEFINLDALLADITVGSKWQWNCSPITVEVTEVSIKTGKVYYKINGVAKKYSSGGNYIQGFKDEMKKIPQ